MKQRQRDYRWWFLSVGLALPALLGTPRCNAPWTPPSIPDADAGRADGPRPDAARSADPGGGADDSLAPPADGAVGHDHGQADGGPQPADGLAGDAAPGDATADAAHADAAADAAHADTPERDGPAPGDGGDAGQLDAAGPRDALADSLPRDDAPGPELAADSAPDVPAPYCGNGQCDNGEDCAACPADCGPCCPNGQCDNGEDCAACPADCGPCCDPPNTLPINGECVPSCGGAGGNTCVGADSTLCSGLPQLPAYDCPVCCFRPSYPGPSVHSYHTVHKDDVWAWDSIWALAQSYPDPGPLITSQNRPDGVPPGMWGQRIDVDWYATGTDMAEAIHQALTPVESAPRVILIDELKTNPPETPAKVAECADRLRTLYPQWQGRWGAWIVNGGSVHFDNLNPGLEALLTAHAVIVVEEYPLQSDYCGSGASAGARDQWLADFFRGDQGAFPFHRFHWLMQRREQLGSASHVSIAFAVTDNYLNGASPAVFLDRLFYVWRTRSGYPGLMFVANGGVGAWKWDEPDMSNTSRDAAFAESFEHYCVQQQSNSLKGQVPCN